MAYTNYYPSYQPGLYNHPKPDQLAQLRQTQTLQNFPQQIQQPVFPVQQVQPQGDSTGIIWVQGDAGAKAYMVAPGNTVPLWDSENQTIYLKSVDMSGMPSTRVLDYTERGADSTRKQAAPPVDLSQFVTRDQLEDILTERLKKPARTAKTKEDLENG